MDLILPVGPKNKKAQTILIALFISYRTFGPIDLDAACPHAPRFKMDYFLILILVGISVLHLTQYTYNLPSEIFPKKWRYLSIIRESFSSGITECFAQCNATFSILCFAILVPFVIRFFTVY